MAKSQSWFDTLFQHAQGFDTYMKKLASTSWQDSILFNSEVITNLPPLVEGEPPGPPSSGLKTVKEFLVLLLSIWVVGSVSLLLSWPWLVLLLWYGYPPHVPEISQLLKYCWFCVVFHGEAGVVSRTWMVLLVVYRAVWVPLSCLFWYIDEILYGNQLKNVQFRAPLFEISAPRSGSTQLAHYLGEDASLTGPNSSQVAFPYLWMWKLSQATIGRFVSKETISEKLVAMIPETFKERHEIDFFGYDTLEIDFMHRQLFFMNRILSPAVASEEFSFARTPKTVHIWDDMFTEYLDRLARKHMIFCGNEDGAKRLFMKGHFLGAAEALRIKYSDATFFTVIRPPNKLLQSYINFFQCHPSDPVLGREDWMWQTVILTNELVRYCEQEKSWFEKEDGSPKYVVRFNDYVKDLSSTMEFLYKNVMEGKEVPPEVPREHPPRNRHNYSINRSLKDLGVNEAALKARLLEYFEWCAPESERKD